MATVATRTVVVLGSNLPEKVAAEYLGVTVHTLRRKRVYGDGPRFLKMGSRVAYPIEELDAYQASCLRRSTSDPGPAAKTVQTAQQAAKVRQISKASGRPLSAGLSRQSGQGGAEQ